MGRQKGKQQRTKGNVAPSSSARSAELLSKEAGSSLFQTGLGNVPELDGLESITNPVIRMTLKKLYKRDVITKLKALSEFADLCESSEEQEVAMTLPYWPRIYNRLFEDSDRRVREGGQKALLSLVKAVGKNLAPYLKNFMGYWFISQCDPYAPSAFVAESALTFAFKDEKKLQAFVFCREEILQVLNHYLFRSTLQYSVQDQKEEENNGPRIVGSCLEALASYIKVVSSHKPADEEIEDIISRGQFWKFQKHKYPPVRGSFYFVIESLCLVLPNLLEKNLTEACKATFHRLDESNVSIVKPLYGAAVALVSTYESWHKEVDINKGVLPSLYNNLKNGCHGFASVVLPSLLPLLNKFPDSCGLLHAYQKIFEGIQECLRHDQIYLSRKNLKLASATFVELLQLFVIHTSEGEITSEDVDFVVKNLIYILDLSFKEKEKKLCNSGLYSFVVKAIHSWTSKRYEVENNDLYDTLCSAFWEEIGQKIKDLCCPNNKPEEILSAISNVLMFLWEMLHSQVSQSHGATKEKGLSVSFAGDRKADEPDFSNEEEPDFNLSKVFYDVQQKVNIILAKTVFRHPFNQADGFLQVYSDILKDFANKDLFQMILLENLPELASDTPPIYYFNEILVKDVIKLSENLPREAELLSDIMFYCLNHCEELKEMPKSLDVFCQAETDDPKFFISLYLFVRLSNQTTSSNYSIWMRNIMTKPDSLAWEFMDRLMDCLIPHTCDPKNFDDRTERFMQGLKLLLNLFTSEHILNNKETIFLSSQSGFEKSMKKLMNNLKLLKDSCTCFHCYNKCLLKFSNFLLSCDQGQMDYSFLSNSNVWFEAMTCFIQIYFLIGEEIPETLSMLSSLFDHAILKMNSGKITLSEIEDFIQHQMVWLKKNYMLDAHYLPERIFLKVNNVLEMLNSQNGEMSPSLMGYFLPDSSEWNSIRPFEPEKWCAVRNLTALSGTDKENETLEEKYISVVDAYYGSCVKIDSLLNQSETDAALFDKIMLICEESAIAAVLTDNDVTSSLFDITGDEFCQKFQREILTRSHKIGGVWPECVGKMKNYLNTENCKEIVQMLIEALHGNASEISKSLIKTVHILSRILPSGETKDIPGLIIEKSVSDETPNVNLFSLGINIMSESYPEYSDKITVNINKYFDQILIWRKEKESIFLFEGNLNNSTEEILIFNADIASFFSLAVDILSTQLSEDHWDFICCLVVSWLENTALTAEESQNMSAFVLKLLNEASRLVFKINSFMSSPTAKDDPTVPNNLISEWTEFFSVAVHTSLLQIFIKLCVDTKYKIPRRVLHNLCKSLQHASENDLTSVVSHLKPKLSADSQLSDEVQTLLNHLCPLLYPQKSNCCQIADNCSIQLTSYKLLCELLPKMKVTVGNMDVPIAIKNIIKKSSNIINGLLTSIPTETPKSRVGDDSPDNDEEANEEEEHPDETDAPLRLDIKEYATPVLAYLLSWKLLIKLTKYISSENRSSYVDALNTSDLSISDDLLPKLFKLMTGKLSHFKTDPPHFYEGHLDKNNIEHMACSVYKEYLLEMPAASRMWFNDLSKVARSRVDKFTSTYVSPVLIERELKAVKSTKHEQATEGMDIIARPSAREVYAAYKINEVYMEIAVCLSPNHPLGPIAVNTEKRAGVVMGQWRYWILQITTFLQYQNGGIIDGLLLWKDKVDKRFEGLEECMICFSVVHGSNQTLPKLKCKTCKKKYHAECLYKWFDTSNNSTCPLCRTPMIFR